MCVIAVYASVVKNGYGRRVVRDSTKKCTVLDTRATVWLGRFCTTCTVLRLLYVQVSRKAAHAVLLDSSLARVKS